MSATSSVARPGCPPRKLMPLGRSPHMHCYRLHLRFLALCQSISLRFPIIYQSILVRPVTNIWHLNCYFWTPGAGSTAEPNVYGGPGENRTLVLPSFQSSSTTNIFDIITLYVSLHLNLFILLHPASSHQIPALFELITYLKA